MSPLRSARRHQVVVAAGALALLGAAAACSNDRASATGPQPSVAAAVAQSTTITVPALTRDVPLAQDITVSAAISKQGGSITIPEAGLKLIVPADAVKRRTIFTVTAKAGSLVAYDFGPAGSVFPVPLRVSQELKGTSWWKVFFDLNAVQGAYYESDAQLDESTGTAAVTEFVPTDVDLNMAKVSFDVRHFSGYVIATGR